MSNSTISGTRPERDFAWLSEYSQNARSFHADFIRQVDRVEAGSPSLTSETPYRS